ncbi:Kinetochore protein Nuf2 [Holothuria leucospilota]|uniref:Kinetochore protein Nuf2 n=1 Tax=Holothuria leucospilota TaxID=206669 RepID=A0A9Q1C424_HOLLE|nr:Kinetochore protein Nuf2 [Holothuria leucospilota]
MAECMSFPFLSSSDIVQGLQDYFPDEPFSEDDFKSPQPNRIHLAYSLLLECVTNADLNRVSQAQFAASQAITNPEYAENIIPTIQFALALQRVLVTCHVSDFKITDLQQPKPKRTRRFLSALINFARFRDCRLQEYAAIKDGIEKVKEEHSAKMKSINSLKERINQIRSARAEEEALLNQFEAGISEESQKLAANHRRKEEIQRKTSQIKTAISEKNARMEQLKVSCLNAREYVNKLHSQVVQSPERMKADISRMQSTLASMKEAKLEKGQRLRELQSQAEAAGSLIEASKQSIELVTSLNASLAKKKEAQSQVEQIQDKIQAQRGVLTDLTNREEHFCRLRESKQDKLSKLKLQHQHAVAAWQQTIQKEEGALQELKQKQEKNLEQVKCFQEPMMLFQKQLSEKERCHDEEMQNLKENYSNLLQAVDSYHNTLAMEWDAKKPQNILR